MLKEEHNSRVHLFAAIVVVFAGIYFTISTAEWIGVLLSIGLVFCMELVNSSLENMADFISPSQHDSIKKIKDLGAGAVLVAAIIAVIIGGLVFLPKIVSLFF